MGSPTGRVFEDLGAFWSEIAQALPTEKQVAFVQRVLKPDGLVLDLGCGSGRHSIGLRTAGWDMVGLDASRVLLTLAKRKMAEAKAAFPLVRADMRFLPFRSGAFSGVVSLDTSFGYLSDEAADLRCLSEVQRVLGAGGVFLVDVFGRDRMAAKYGGRLSATGVSFLSRFPMFAAVFSGLFRWREYPSFRLLQKRRVVGNGEKLQDLWLVKRKADGKIGVYRHVVRLYAASTLQRLLEQSGLQVKGTFGGYEEESYIRQSKRLILVATKIFFTKPTGK